MMKTLCHFEIPADNLESLKNFYSKMFGWTFEKMPGPMEYPIIKTGSEELMGGMMQRQDPSHGPINYIMVSSVDGSLKRAQDLGATVCVTKTPVPGMGWFTVLTEPQKKPFGLWHYSLIDNRPVGPIQMDLPRRTIRGNRSREAYGKIRSRPMRRFLIPGALGPGTRGSACHPST